VASMIHMFYKYSRPNVAELGIIPNTRLFKNLERNPEAKAIDRLMILRVDASFSFVNADFFRDYIIEKSRERNQSTRYVIIDGSTINTLDTTAIEKIKSMVGTLNNWDIELYIAGLKGPVRDVVDKSGLREYLGSDHYFRDPHEAVSHILEKMDQEDKETDKTRLANYNDVTG